MGPPAIPAQPAPSHGFCSGTYPPPERFRRLSGDEREQRFAQMCSGIRDPEQVWVFAYGSLMWRPAFEPREQIRARLPGYHRSFCFWTCRARGSPQAPGLGLGLEPGPRGSVGVAQRLDRATLDEQLRVLWEREMDSGVYHCRWVNLYLDSGARVRAMTFVADTAHPQYAGGLSWQWQAEVIARARGRWGACRDYLAGVVSALDELNAPEAHLEQLLHHVDRLRQAG